jgi:endonuclease/exonuclease/phosphatase family metal-dependent hydrolase
MAQLKVFSFNIQGGRGMDNQLDLDRQAALIRAWQPDIVMLQEVHWGTNSSGGVNQAQELARKTGLGTWAFGRAIDFEGGWFGNAMLSRYPLTGLQNFIVPKPPGWELPWNWTQDRAVLHATADVAGIQHYLFCTHYSSRWDAYRVAHGEFLLNRITALPQGPPIILGGDLNATSEAREVAILRSVLKDASKVFNPAASERIDYIFFGGLYQYLVGRFEDIGTDVSDHNPVYAELSSKDFKEKEKEKEKEKDRKDVKEKDRKEALKEKEAIKERDVMLDPRLGQTFGGGTDPAQTLADLATRVEALEERFSLRGAFLRQESQPAQRTELDALQTLADLAARVQDLEERLAADRTLSGESPPSQAVGEQQPSETPAEPGAEDAGDATS